jgi:thiosulfate dehydrogenase [quinone] large subunit
MLVTFFESIKHVGHLFPIVILRVFMGIYFLNLGITNVHGPFLNQPVLAEMIRDWSPTSGAPVWYKEVLEAVVLPQWQMAAYCIVYLQLVIGVSFLLGFFIRPVSLLGFLLAWNFIYWSPIELRDFYALQMTCFLLLFLIGAGRCLGIDSYFYKRNRGMWW